MNDRLWRHALSISGLESYSPSVQGQALSGANLDLVEEAREFLFSKEVPTRKVIDRIAHLFSIPDEIPRASYRTWRSVPFSLSDAFTVHGVKGGAARNLLFARIFGVDYPVHARDIDVVRFGSRIESIDRAMAAQFMKRDTLHGAGVELLTSLDRYLESRDLTVNEVLWNNGSLTASERAIGDMAGLVLRPSKIYFGSIHRPPAVKGRIVLKMVRVAVEGAQLGIPWKISGLPEKVDVSEFDLAIELSKAFERGVACARMFVACLDELRLLPNYASEDLLGAVVDDLEHLSLGTRAPLTFVPADMLKKSKAGASRT